MRTSADSSMVSTAVAVARRAKDNEIPLLY